MNFRSKSFSSSPSNPSSLHPTVPLPQSREGGSIFGRRRPSFCFPPRLAGGGEAGETAAQNGRPKTCPSFVSEGKRSLSASFFLPSLSGDANLGPLGTWRRRAAIPFPAAVRKGDRPASPDLPPSGRNLAPILLPPLLTHKGEKKCKMRERNIGLRSADSGGRMGEGGREGGRHRLRCTAIETTSSSSSSGSARRLYYVYFPWLYHPLRRVRTGGQSAA